MRPSATDHIVRMSAAMMLASLLLAVTTSPAHAQEEPLTCDVVIAAELGGESTGALGALDVRVGYVNAAGEFAGSDDQVECSFLASGALASENDVDAARELDLGLIAAPGIELPAQLWSCTFLAEGSEPTAEDFALVVDSAVRPDFLELEVEAFIDSITCRDGTDCGNGIVEEGEECDDGSATATCTGNCRLSPELQLCEITVRLKNEAVVGGLELTIDYGETGGSFEGSGADVSCIGENLEHAYTALNDRDNQDQLELAFISATGVTSPADLWTCRFLTPGDAPTVEQLSPTNVEAVGVDRAPASVQVAVDVVGCAFGPTKVCGDADGNGSVQAGDALRVLKNAVGQNIACPIQACDADGNGSVQAVDALRVLRKAVGQNVPMNCPS